MNPFIKNNIYGLETDGIRYFRWSKPSFVGEFINSSKKYVMMNIGSPNAKNLHLKYQDGEQITIEIKSGWQDYLFEHKNNKIEFSTDKSNFDGDIRDLGVMISSIQYYDYDRIYKNLLLVGSAWYLKEWWHDNIHKYKFDSIYCINNSFLVTQDLTDTWYIASDFLVNNNFDLKRFLSDSVYDKYPRITSRFLQEPYWYITPENNHGTMLFNTLYDILNYQTLNNNNFILNIIGCDLNYSNINNHFYGSGTPDPLRFGEEYLIKQLNLIKYIFEKTGNKIYNLSNEKGLLPFDKY